MSGDVAEPVNNRNGIVEDEAVSCRFRQPPARFLICLDPAIQGTGLTELREHALQRHPA